jgi:hypothetical protein
MVQVTVEVDQDVYEVLETLAEMQGGTVSDVLRNMVVDDLERIKRRLKDPIVGGLGPFLKDNVEQDIASRADDIIASEWEPD